MKKIPVLVKERTMNGSFGLIALALFSLPAKADDMPELAKARNCATCHAIEKKIVGPSWLKISKRYQGNKEAHQLLVSKIRMGGSGMWGSMPMPPQTVSIDEAEKLVGFILNLDSGSLASR